MPTRVRDYFFAADVDDATRLLQEPDAAPWIASPRMPESPPAESLIDLQHAGLDLFSREGDTLRIGGQVTLESLATHSDLLSEANGILAQAARLACHRGLRNLATVQGALASDDGPPEMMLALSVLQASALVRSSAGSHIAEVHAGLRRGDLLVEVSLPLAPARRGALVRVARTPLDQAIVAAVAVAQERKVTVAVSAEAGSFSQVNATLGDRPLKPGELSAHIKALAADVVEQIQPLGDHRGSATYRRAMAEVLARRALRQVLLEEEPL